MNNKVLLQLTMALSTLVCGARYCRADEALTTNIYSRVQFVYEGSSVSPDDYFHAVRSLGIYRNLSTNDMSKFFALRDVVSNNCAQIAMDWQAYETNEMVRFTTLCAVADSGLNTLTNFANTILTNYEANTNYCQWATIEYFIAPYGVSSEQCVAFHYDDPVVSNILVRIRAQAESIGSTNDIMAIDFILSGESKQYEIETHAPPL